MTTNLHAEAANILQRQIEAERRREKDRDIRIAIDVIQKLYGYCPKDDRDPGCVGCMASTIIDGLEEELAQP